MLANDSEHAGRIWFARQLDIETAGAKSQQRGEQARVVDKTDSFKPNDTIYASIATGGTAATATLKGRWTYQDGQVVNESTQTIAPTGDARTEFHISKPDGWPTGKYKLEVFLNGFSAATKDFEVTQ